MPVLNTSLLAIGWKVQGNGPQRSSKTEVHCWFLPVLVLANRQFSQMTGERLSAMAVSWRRKATSFPRWTLGSILIVLSQLSGAGLHHKFSDFLPHFVGFCLRCKGVQLEVWIKDGGTTVGWVFLYWSSGLHGFLWGHQGTWNFRLWGSCLCVHLVSL